MQQADERRTREGIRSLHRSEQGRCLWRPCSNAILRLEQERVCASVETAPRTTCPPAAQRRAYGFPGFWGLVQFFESRQSEPISPSPYAASTASHTCRIMAPGRVIPDVSNCPFMILFANSIPLNVTFAFLNL